MDKVNIDKAVNAVRQSLELNAGEQKKKGDEEVTDVMVFARVLSELFVACTENDNPIPHHHALQGIAAFLNAEAHRVGEVSPFCGGMLYGVSEQLMLIGDSRDYPALK